MTQLLVQGEVILAQGPFEMDADNIKAADQIIPKHVVPGWSMVDVEVPANFTCSAYTWSGTELVVKPPVVVYPTVEEYTVAVQAHLDSKAKAKNYDDIVSVCSYAGAANPFQAEGIAFVAWRGSVWAKCYEIMALVQSGQRTAPTIEELIAELPDLVL